MNGDTAAEHSAETIMFMIENVVMSRNATKTILMYCKLMQASWLSNFLQGQTSRKTTLHRKSHPADLKASVARSS